MDAILAGVQLNSQDGPKGRSLPHVSAENRRQPDLRAGKSDAVLDQLAREMFREIVEIPAHRIVDNLFEIVGKTGEIPVVISLSFFHL